MLRISSSSRTTAALKRQFGTVSSSRCVIIGGGIAGVSISMQLAKKGLKVDLLEKSKMLCAGATWHAAGLVTRFAGSPKLKKLHVRAVEVLQELHAAHDISLHSPGSIRIIQKGDTNRFKEASQHVAMATLYDNPKYPTRMISPQEVVALHPLCDPSNVECGVHTPFDGDIDPTCLANAVGKLAKEAGAQYHFESEVVSVTQPREGLFIVKTRDGKQYEADVLINAAGLWAKNVTAMVEPNMFHPAYIIEHQYTITEAIPAIEQRMAKMGEAGRLPVLRDLAGSSYIRQEQCGLLTGPYEEGCRLAPEEWRMAPPSKFEFDLFPGNLEAIESNLVSASELIPVMAEVGIKTTLNGPTIWTGDSLPRCGRTAIPGYYDFNTLTYGIAQAVPLSEYLAHIITEGEQPFDMAAQCDPFRYGDWTNPGYVEAVVLDSYAKNNSPVFPFENRKAGRAHLTKIHEDPLHKQLKEAGAHFSFSLSGVETPAFFLQRGESADQLVEAKYDNHDWIPIVDREIAAVRDNVAISHASFSKMSVNGPKAADFLNYVCTNALPPVGKTRLSYATTKAGNVLAEFSISKLADNDFYLIGSRDYAHHDTQWLVDRARDGRWRGGVTVKNISNEVDILHIAGPKSRDFLVPFCASASDLPFLGFTDVVIGGIKARLFRVSFSGGPGYEIHCNAGPDIAEIHRALTQSEEAKLFGLTHFGGYALNAFRVERGFKVKGDFDYAHYSEASIDVFISKKKRMGETPFYGQDVKHKPKRLAAYFQVQTLPGWEWSVPGDCPVRLVKDGSLFGYTTTAAKGALSGGAFAHGYSVYRGADGELAQPTDLELYCDAYSQRFPVKFLAKPIVPVTGQLPWK